MADKAEWRQAKEAGAYSPESIGLEGFIHCSTKAVLIKVANLFFKGNGNLLLLKIDSSRVKSKLQYDRVEDLDASFPHIYGPLNIEAAVDEIEFKPGADGTFTLPDGVE